MPCWNFPYATKNNHICLIHRDLCHRNFRLAEQAVIFSDNIHILANDRSEPRHRSRHVRIAKKHSPFNFAIGYIYWKDRAFEDSRPWLARELEVQPCHALAAYYLGDAAQALGQKQDALRYFQQSVTCNNRNQKAHLGLGILLAELNRDQEALGELQAAARLDEKDATVHYRLALLYKKLGRKSDSAAEYAKVQQIHDAGRKQAEQNLAGK